MRQVFTTHRAPFSRIALQQRRRTSSFVRLQRGTHRSLGQVGLDLNNSATRRFLHRSFVPRQDGAQEASAQSLRDSVEGGKLTTVDLSQIMACPGCGALAQSIESGQPGYYNVTRRAVVAFFKAQVKSEDSQFAIQDSIPSELDQIKLSRENDQARASNTPVCDRCHHLTHHNVKLPVPNPTIDSINDIIDSTPWKYNHIIHVIDAADFPLSAVRGIQELLNASPQRSRNRRSRTTRYNRDRVTDLSFVITRSDLLAPKKEMVDSLMPTLVRILQRHLGFDGQRKRFGNVRCVSSTRGWWTPEVKADLRAKGGAVWLVGKENVGKSKLFEVIFPRGKLEDFAASDTEQGTAEIQQLENSSSLPKKYPITTHSDAGNEDILDLDNFLLPPARQEVPYPLMPTVSEMPGTTASPIRIPFGNGKGEMVDLPGLERGHIQALVQTPYQSKILMKKRVSNPTRYLIKPGQSLLLGGGLVRLTPLYQDAPTIMTPFVTIDGHQTSNEKAAQIQNGIGDVQVTSILTDASKQDIASAGIFKISQDATKARAGPLTDRSAVGLKPERLPFRVFATDIVIEGLGWVDVAVQVRTRDYPHGRTDFNVPLPALEVFTPHGKYVAGRETLNAGQYMGPRDRSRGSRPRRSMARARKSIKTENAMS